MQPFQHNERAAALLAEVEGELLKLADLGATLDAEAREVMNLKINLACAHAQVAQARMTGSLRR